MRNNRTPDFDDNNFLQDWLENRYGFGFARAVMDDLGCEDVTAYAPYELCQTLAVNDNAHNHQTQKAS